MNYPKLQTYELWGKRSPQRLISEGGYHFPRILLCYKKRVGFLTTIGSILLSWHVYKTCVLLRGVFSLQIIPKQSFFCFFFCRFFTHERVEHCKHLIFVEFRQCLSLALSFGSIASYLCLEFFLPFFSLLFWVQNLLLWCFLRVLQNGTFFFKGESAFQRTGSGSGGNGWNIWRTLFLGSHAKRWLRSFCCQLKTAEKTEWFFLFYFFVVEFHFLKSLRVGVFVKRFTIISLQITLFSNISTNILLTDTWQISMTQWLLNTLRNVLSSTRWSTFFGKSFLKVGCKLWGWFSCECVFGLEKCFTIYVCVCLFVSVFLWDLFSYPQL